MNILIPYLHYIGIMALMGSLITEHVMLKPGISKKQLKSLATVDLLYGISLVVVLVTGLLRWFVIDVKGVDFFSKNPLFHIKLTLFVIVVILSVFPTMKFLKWRKESATIPSDKELKKQLMFIRIELLLMAIIPLLAVMVANGVRM
jgi:putative membrane protein